MIRKLLLIILLPFLSHAQNSFEKYGGSGNQRLIKNLEDSSILILGNTYFLGLTKMNQAGMINSIKCLLPTDTSIHPFYSEFTETSDGNFIAGFAYNPKNTALIKFDTAGNILWCKAYENIQLTYSLSETSDHGFVMTGQRQYSNIGGVYYDKIILKTDSIGNIMWDNLIPYNAITSSYKFKILQSDDGGYLMQSCNSIIKLDSSGNVIRSFDRQPVLTNYDLNKIIKISSNKYLSIGGTLRCVDSTGAILWEKANLQNQYLYKDAYKINDTTIELLGPEFQVWEGIFTEKIDFSGNLLEHMSFDANMTTLPLIFSPALDGGVIICGLVDPYQIQNYSCFVIKTDSIGHPYCGSFLSYNPFISMYDIYNISNPTFIAGDANLIASPTFWDTTIVHGVEVEYCNGSNSILETSFGSTRASISPNPNDGSFELEFSSPTSKGDFTISNNLGQVVSKGKLTDVSHLHLEISGASGLYFLSIRNGSEQFNLPVLKQ